MKLYRRIYIFIFLIPFWFYLISCDGKPLESITGTITISVIDNDSANTPIPNVDITITPGNIVKKTDVNGLCSFDLLPGDYYVNANVCCIGPGTINYHEPITVVQNVTKEVILVGCLGCV